RGRAHRARDERDHRPALADRQRARAAAAADPRHVARADGGVHAREPAPADAHAVRAVAVPLPRSRRARADGGAEREPRRDAEAPQQPGVRPAIRGRFFGPEVAFRTALRARSPQKSRGLLWFPERPRCNLHAPLTLRPSAPSDRGLTSAVAVESSAARSL